MNKSRLLILLAAVVVSLGSLVLTSAYAIHLRSEGYRREVEQDLSGFFQLPCEVGGIRGKTFSSREFQDVVIHLPDRRDQVFACQRAIWHEDLIEGRPTQRLELSNGVLHLGSDRWQHGDYHTVFESGLGHDFAAMKLGRVHLADFKVAFQRQEFVLECGGVVGEVDFQGQEEGTARLEAFELNGMPVREGVSIVARFSLRKGVDVKDVTLELPEVPLSKIGLESALSGEITQGSFAGTVRYTSPKDEDAPEVWLSGKLQDSKLSELSRRLPFGPFEGTLSVRIEEARVAKGMLTDLRGRGEVHDLSFAPFAALLGVARLSGRASFDLNPVDISRGTIHKLEIEGEIEEVSLEEVLRALGKGTATGRAIIRVNHIDIVENAVKSADIELNIVPPAGQPGLVSRTLILDAAERFFDFTWPSSLPQGILPEQLEYVECGVRFMVRDSRLRLMGTHGVDNDTVLTIQIFGQRLGVVKAPATTYDLTPFIERGLSRLRSYDSKRMKEWLRTGGRQPG